MDLNTHPKPPPPPPSPKRYHPYTPRSGPIPPGLHDAARSLGIISPMDLTLDKVEQVCSRYSHWSTISHANSKGIHLLMHFPQCLTGSYRGLLTPNEPITTALPYGWHSQRWKSNLPKNEFPFCPPYVSSTMEILLSVEHTSTSSIEPSVPAA